MNLYSKEIMKHFKKPQNVGKIKNPSGLGKVGNIKCGDIMHLYLKIAKDKKEREVIKDVKFETFGCTVAVANTSLLTTMVKGKTIENALKITKEDLVKKLGDVPAIKMHCSMLAVDALGEAIYDYYKKEGKEIAPDLQKRHEHAEKVEREIKRKFHGEEQG
ncbi:MAG: iron-sulfur cluster assembly scaffold protein [Candidatus Pacebacteria bacterium]|nr:iron-sulfur cluster assembly scaffold protein [Candidatus Paceibacterota bacterium]